MSVIDHQGQHRSAVDHREDWRSYSACRGEDPELFFPLSAAAAFTAQIESAKAICASCPVRQQCLRFALTTGQTNGIWGGTTEEERSELREARAPRGARLA